MAQIVTPAVIIPRFTTLTHTGLAYQYFTLPVDVSAFDRGLITGWRGVLSGTSPQFGFAFYESIDRITWHECDGTSGLDDPGEAQEKPYSFLLSRRWFRMGIMLSGTGAMVTCWAQGFLMRRRP